MTTVTPISLVLPWRGTGQASPPSTVWFRAQTVWSGNVYGWLDGCEEGEMDRERKKRKGKRRKEEEKREEKKKKEKE